MEDTMLWSVMEPIIKIAIMTKILKMVYFIVCLNIRKYYYNYVV